MIYDDVITSTFVIIVLSEWINLQSWKFDHGWLTPCM